MIEPAEVPASCRIEDVGDRVVLPGLIDTHVHINEPGRTEWEGFVTATRAAAAGGITTLVDMPLNSSPVTTTAEALARKLEAARGKLSVDCGFYGGVVPGASGQVGPLVAAGVLGFKAFLCHSGIDEFPNATEADLRAVMPELARAGVPLLVHAELIGDSPLAAPATALERRSYARHLASRPREWEHDAIRLMIDLCREFRCRVHIVHLSSADALPMIAQARERGPAPDRRDLPALPHVRRRRDPRRRPPLQVCTADQRAREPRTPLGGPASGPDRHDRHGPLAGAP